MAYGFYSRVFWLPESRSTRLTKGHQRPFVQRMALKVSSEKKSLPLSLLPVVLPNSVLFTPFHPLSHPDRNFLIPGSVLTCCCKNWLEVVKDSGHLSLSQLLTYNRLNGKATSLAWKIVSQSKLRTLEWKFGMIYWVLIENSVRPMPAQISPLYIRLGPGVYRRSIFKIRPNILIGLQKLWLRPKDRSRLFIYLIFLRQFS